MTGIAQREDRVYVTSDRNLARAWAGIWTPDGVHHGGGALYQVEAEDLEPDEDLLSLGGLSFQVARARVLTVYDPHVAYQAKFGRVLERVLSQHAAAKVAPRDGA